MGNKMIWNKNDLILSHFHFNDQSSPCHNICQPHNRNGKEALTIQNKDNFSFKKVQYASLEGLKSQILTNLVSQQQKKSQKLGRNFIKK